MKIQLHLIGAVALMSASTVMASGHGGAPSMLCAVTHTVSCDTLGKCVNGPANAVNLPVFLNFDPGKKMVESAKQGGERRTSAIASVSMKGNHWVLLGDEGNSGWSVSIDQSTGGMTGTIAEQGTGYIIFGSCLAR